MSVCDHMLVYLNAQTWTHNPEAFADEIREAMRAGLHLQPCHEFPSVIDMGSERQALEFKEIMDATPADLRKGPTNIYSQIAISMKGGDLREPGLANLAARLSVRVPRDPVSADSAESSQPRRVALPTFVRNSIQRFDLIRARRRTHRREDANVGAVHPRERLPRTPRTSQAFILRCFKSKPAIVNATPATCTTTVSALEVESSL